MRLSSGEEDRKVREGTYAGRRRPARELSARIYDCGLCLSRVPREEAVSGGGQGRRTHSSKPTG